ncbi:hypothetical protein, partial [Pedobacter sp.]|uniref:hypothetical protein n=1 Tax=Pedobacter sp. TaxID=1411316 RepID=UPI002CC521F2
MTNEKSILPTITTTLLDWEEINKTSEEKIVTIRPVCEKDKYVLAHWTAEGQSRTTISEILNSFTKYEFNSHPDVNSLIGSFNKIDFFHASSVSETKLFRKNQTGFKDVRNLKLMIPNKFAHLPNYVALAWQVSCSYLFCQQG